MLDELQALRKLAGEVESYLASVDSREELPPKDWELIPMRQAIRDAYKSGWPGRWPNEPLDTWKYKPKT